MILYIHGFGSSGVGSKALRFRQHYANHAFIAPSLSHIPTLAIDTLQQIIEYALAQKEPVYLIGSSLGGYMACYLSSRYDLKAVLINPAMEPVKTLQRGLGLSHHYYDLSQFEWNRQHLKMLEAYEVHTINPANFMLLLQKGDETLDYQEALSFFERQGIDQKQCIVEEGGSHSFEAIASKFDQIDAFFGITY